MRILVVTQYFWPENFRINDIVEALHIRGHQITVLTGHPNYPKGKFFRGYTGKSVIHEVYQGIEIIRVPIFPRGEDGNSKLIINYLSFVISGTIFALFSGKRDFDVILFNGLSPTIAGIPATALKMKYKRPLLTYIQDLWPESLLAVRPNTSQFAISLLRILTTYIYKQSEQVWASSKSFLNRIENLGISRKKLHYFPQYAESFYKPEPRNPVWAHENGLPNGFIVMFAGNIGIAQDLPNVIQAAELTQEHGIHWVFLGTGSAKVNLAQQAEAKNLNNVHFLGSFPARTMPHFFAQADVLLVSLADQELFAMTIPAKVQSYLASGRPILASLAGEGAEVVRDSEAGVVVSPENPQALAKAAIALKALTESERTIMGQRGRAYFVKNFERESKIEELESTLLNLACSKQNFKFKPYSRSSSDDVFSHRIEKKYREYIVFRSLLERIVGTFVTALVLPLLLVIALLIRLDSRGSALFIQERAGRYHRPFKIYKFRTMRADTPHLSTEEMQRSGLNPITRLGGFLRRTSLDELPQLINIIKGEMSFIGPRPALMTQENVLRLREQAGVDRLKPGITGYAQVTGRDNLSDEEKVSRDAYYLQHVGLKMDIMVLLQTFTSVFRGTGNK